jgi:peptidoglycan/LPS O-acetylase OafA/YrhL
MSSSVPRRFWTLDALRGICALVVFLSHWHLWAQFAPAGVVERGLHRAMDSILAGFTALAWPTGGNHPAVICFFVLSGFCIHYPFARGLRGDPGTTASWRDFYRRRFFRIMPVYWTAALLGLVFVSAELRQPSGDGLLALHSQSSPTDVLIRLSATTDLVPREILAGNAPLSTVGIEILLYLAYPVFFWAARRRQWVALGAVFFGFEGAGLALLSRVSSFWIYNSLFMYGVFWYAGALTADYFVRHGTRSYRHALVFSWAGFVLLNAAPHFYGLSVLKQNLWGLVCVFGVLQCLHLETRFASAVTKLPVRVLCFTGEISYSLYAVHTPALLLATWALIHFGVASYSMQLAVTLAAAIAVTLIVYYAIERTFYRPRTRVPIGPARSIRAASEPSLT